MNRSVAVLLVLITCFCRCCPAVVNAMERTEVKINTISEQLGLSWAELARELHFSVDDINRIRVENPNSLLDQSTALLNLWATRESRRAKMETLCTALKNIDRADIVAALEAAQPTACSSEEGACRLSNRDSALLSPSIINGFALVQDELLSPASLQYSLASPLGTEPYWRDVSSLDCAPIATTEEDTLMEMSEMQVWPAGLSPSLVTVEDSSLEGSSRADDSEGATLSLPCSLGRPSSGASGSIVELEGEEEDEEGEVEEEEAPQELPSVPDRDRVRAGGAVPKVNLNGQLGGQRSDGRRGEQPGGGGPRGSGGLVEGCFISGQQVFIQEREMRGPAVEHQGDKRVVGGGAFSPYVSDKDSLRGWAGSLGRDVSHLRVAQERVLTPRQETEEDPAESSCVPEHGNTRARKVGPEARRGSPALQRSGLRRLNH